MAGKLCTKALILLVKYLLRRTGNSFTLQSNGGNGHASQLKFHKYHSVVHRSEELSNQTLMFHVEGVLLKSPSLFPYFMLVAFEAGLLEDI
ncbi:hypothetical protein L1049_021182 [Liquidambar formosana]|uniref:Glycerol-3-phosphate acyltransferase RAM2/GPAT1-8 HAD-like domain-containing protein n=1 Tax=Liquidambar formosana TaxID=63359 RepID=A0AAP0S8W8_LIQFO